MSSLEVPVVLQDSPGFAFSCPCPALPCEDVLELGLLERSPKPILTLHCGPWLPISRVLRSFWALEIQGTQQELQGRAGSVSPVPPISDGPHPGLASPCC